MNSNPRSIKLPGLKRMTGHPRPSATALTIVVLDVPGGPKRRTETLRGFNGGSPRGSASMGLTSFASKYPRMGGSWSIFLSLKNGAHLNYLGQSRSLGETDVNVVRIL